MAATILGYRLQQTILTLSRVRVYHQLVPESQPKNHAVPIGCLSSSSMSELQWLSCKSI